MQDVHAPDLKPKKSAKGFPTPFRIDLLSTRCCKRDSEYRSSSQVNHDNQTAEDHSTTENTNRKTLRVFGFRILGKPNPSLSKPGGSGQKEFGCVLTAAGLISRRGGGCMGFLSRAALGWSGPLGQQDMHQKIAIRAMCRHRFTLCAARSQQRRRPSAGRGQIEGANVHNGTKQ